MTRTHNDDYLALYSTPKDRALLNDHSILTGAFPDIMALNVAGLEIDAIFAHCYNVCCQKIAPFGLFNNPMTTSINLSLYSPDLFQNDTPTLPGNNVLSRAMLVEYCILSTLNTINNFMYRKYIFNPRDYYNYQKPERITDDNARRPRDKGDYTILPLPIDNSNPKVKGYLEKLLDSPVEIFLNHCQPINASRYIGYYNSDFSRFLISSSKRFTKNTTANKKSLVSMAQELSSNINTLAFSEEDMHENIFNHIIHSFKSFSNIYSQLHRECAEATPLTNHASSISYAQKRNLLFNLPAISFLHHIYTHNRSLVLPRNTSRANNEFALQALRFLCDNPFAITSYGTDVLHKHSCPSLISPDKYEFFYDKYLHNIKKFLPVLVRLFFFKIMDKYSIKYNSPLEELYDIENDLISYISSCVNMHNAANEVCESFLADLAKRLSEANPSMTLDSYCSQPFIYRDTIFRNAYEAKNCSLEYTNLLIPRFESYTAPKKGEYPRFLLKDLSEDCMLDYMSILLSSLFSYPSHLHGSLSDLKT